MRDREPLKVIGAAGMGATAVRTSVDRAGQRRELVCVSRHASDMRFSRV